MNLQEELKALKERIAELEELVKQEQDFPQHFPQYWDDYWYIVGDFDVTDVKWDGGDCDQVRMSVGNVFKTKQQARFALEKLKVEAELRKFGRPFKKGENNCFIEIHLSDKALAIDGSEHFQTQGTIYFESATITNEAIDTVGAERIRKYIFGVED